MTCAERKDLILLHVFDQLEPAEEAALVAHLRDGCPRCVGELAAARAIEGHLTLAVPPVAPSPAVKVRVLTSIARSKVVRRWPAAVGFALLAASVTAVAILIPARRGVEALRGELAAVEAKLRSLGSPATRMTALADAGPQAGASGRLFWDASKGTWQVFVSHMKPTAAGRTYQLWFITGDQRKVPAGTFDVGSDGDATFEVALPRDLGAVALAAVTEEPAGGVPQPTGAIQLVGKLGT